MALPFGGDAVVMTEASKFETGLQVNRSVFLLHVIICLLKYFIALNSSTDQKSEWQPKYTDARWGCAVLFFPRAEQCVSSTSLLIAYNRLSDVGQSLSHFPQAEYYWLHLMDCNSREGMGNSQGRSLFSTAWVM